MRKPGERLPYKFGHAPEFYIETKPRPEDLGVLTFIEWRSGGKDYCSVGSRTLSEGLDMSRERAIQILKRLRKARVIALERNRGNGFPLYRLVFRTGRESVPVGKPNRTGRKIGPETGRESVPKEADLKTSRVTERIAAREDQDRKAIGVVRRLASSRGKNPDEYEAAYRRVAM